jgi:hypothetical protein
MLAAVALWMGASTPSSAYLRPPSHELLETHLAQSIGRERLISWMLFSQQMSLFAWTAAFFLLGNGLRTAWIKRDGSVSYTLTLPVSRDRLIWTQQACGWIAAIGVAALTLAAQCALLLVRGRGIPFVPLAESAAVGAIFLIAWITVLSALTMDVHEIWALLASFPGYIMSMRWVTSTATAFPAYGEFPWVSIAALVAISVLALAFSFNVGRTKEFG